jgi:hypothetical protein
MYSASGTSACPAAKVSAQRRVGGLIPLAIYRREAADNILIDLVPMIPVIGQRRVDLAQREVRELEVKFLRTPAIGGLGGHQLNDFHRRAGNVRDAAGVQDNMFVARFD